MSGVLSTLPGILSATNVKNWIRDALGLYIKFGICHFVVRLSYSSFKRWRIASSLKDVPDNHSDKHWLFGTIPGFIQNRKRLHHYRAESSAGLPVSKSMGPLWDPRTCLVCVRDPAGIKHFLKDAFDKYTKIDQGADWIWLHICTLLGNGIFTVQHGIGAKDGGQEWLRQRKIASNIFSRSNFNENMHGVFVAKAKSLRDALQSGSKVDMQMHLFNFTMDSIMKIFFGEESNSICGEMNKYGQAFDVAHRDFFEYGVTSLGFITVAQLLPFPFGGLKGLCARLHMRMSPVYQEFITNVRTLDTESARIIAGCRADPRLGERLDLLALFMKQVSETEPNTRKADRYLRDAIMNFIIAGRDTTACTLTWLFYILSTHPEIQKRVQEEVDQKLPNGTVPTLKLVKDSNMPLLNALIYETLRLYPPVPFDIKECCQDDVLPDGSHIPRGCKVFFAPWAMGRDPTVWPEPETVDLDRWIPFKQPLPHEFPVFQAGPRICLGMDMAIFETKVCIAMLLQEWSFNLAEGEADSIHYSPMLTMSLCNSKEQDSHNLWLIPEKRILEVAAENEAEEIAHSIAPAISTASSFWSRLMGDQS